MGGTSDYSYTSSSGIDLSQLENILGGNSLNNLQALMGRIGSMLGGHRPTGFAGSGKETAYMHDRERNYKASDMSTALQLLLRSQAQANAEAMRKAQLAAMKKARAYGPAQGGMGAASGAIGPLFGGIQQKTGHAMGLPVGSQADLMYGNVPYTEAFGQWVAQQMAGKQNARDSGMALQASLIDKPISNPFGQSLNPIPYK